MGGGNGRVGGLHVVVIDSDGLLGSLVGVTHFY